MEKLKLSANRRRLLSTKIEGKEWMDWLNKSRADSTRRRKESKQTLPQYLRSVEEKAFDLLRSVLDPPKNEQGDSAATAAHSKLI